MVSKGKTKWKKINKSSISDYIIEQIKQMILDGTLSPGDTLPSERELSELLGVSRVPVREALKILQFIKVIEASQGSPYTVRGIGRARLLDLLEELSGRQYDVLDDLKEVRIALETKGVELACYRRTEEDLAQMRACMENMKKCYERGKENVDSARVVEASIEFHQCMMNASKNELLAVIYAYISDVIREGRVKTLSIPERYEKALDEHVQIYEAIKARDVETAIDCITDHIVTSY